VLRGDLEPRSRQTLRALGVSWSQGYSVVLFAQLVLETKFGTRDRKRLHQGDRYDCLGVRVLNKGGLQTVLRKMPSEAASWPRNGAI
jgi:hypothetical protein